MGRNPVAISDLARTAPGTIRKGPACAVCQALDDLPPDEAAGLRALLADPRWRYTQIAEMVKADPDSPLDIHHSTYARHAKGDCAARTRLR